MLCFWLLSPSSVFAGGTVYSQIRSGSTAQWFCTETQTSASSSSSPCAFHTLNSSVLNVSTWLVAQQAFWTAD